MKIVIYLIKLKFNIFCLKLKKKFESEGVDVLLELMEDDYISWT